MKVQVEDEHQEVTMETIKLVVNDVNEKPSIMFKDVGDIPEMSSQGFLVGSLLVISSLVFIDYYFKIF